LATAQSTLQPQPSTKYVVFIRKAFLKDLLEWFEATGGAYSLDLSKFLTEIIEERLAEYRSLRIKPKLAPGFKKNGETIRQDNYVHQRQLSPAQVQQILHLRLELSIEDLARRFQCGRTTIRRMLERYDRHGVHVRVSARAGNPGADRWWEKV
jgi:hypothetical protein